MVRRTAVGWHVREQGEHGRTDVFERELGLSNAGEDPGEDDARLGE